MSENVSDSSILINNLQKKLEIANSRILELEQECDDLAFENNYLREKLEKFEGMGKDTNIIIANENSYSICKTHEDNTKATDYVSINWDELLEEGTEPFIRKPCVQIDNACGGILLVMFYSL